jgi:hypothetical protein
MIWPPEHIELLRELYQQGTRSWVARELTARTGVAYGRNAIVGKLWRLGLRKPKQTKEKRKVIKHAPTKPPLTIVPTIETRNVVIMDLQQHHCRYICSIGAEPTYCGRRKMDGSSYCAEHHRLCYYGYGRYISA